MNKPIDRPRRYAPTNQRALSLSIEWPGGGDPTVATATLLDISVGGVKLSLNSHLKLHQAISLKIASAELGLDLTVSAKVCWLRPGENEHWTAGCAFMPELSPAALESLFDSGLVERRVFPRQPINLSATAQWELDPTRFDVKLLDVSAGGVCIRSPRPGKIGARVALVVRSLEGREVPMAVRSQWHVAAEGGYFVGCAYVSVAGNTALREILAPPSGQPAARRSRWRPRRALWAVAGLGLAALTWHFGETLLSQLIAHFWARFAQTP